jgi:phosphate transport system substrate-binding protein
MFNRKPNTKLSLSVALVALVLLAAFCASATAATTLTGAGATFPYPIYSKWFDVYGKANGVQINYQPIGSGGGISQLKAKTVDFGGSDAPISDADMKTMPDRVIHIPTVAGAVAIIYNVPGADSGLDLTGEVIADIYLGTIKRWNDKRITSLNPGANLPNKAIAVVHRSDGSGTTNIFTDYLTKVSRPWSVRVGVGKAVDWPTGIGAKGNPGVAGIVKQTVGAIGYVELAYATENKLDFASLRNRAGRYVNPSVESTTAAAVGYIKQMQKDVRVSIVNSPAPDAYPIAGFTYILVYKSQRDARKGRALVDFLDWAIHDGQKYANALHYAPLPPEVVSINEAKLKGLLMG